MKKDTLVYEAPKAVFSEAVRSLRTNITYKMSKDGLKTFLVTSSSTDEGKSCILANLAIAFTQSKQKVLIIDGDLRKGRQHNVFDLDNSVGLSQALDDKEICKENEYIDSAIGKYIKQTEIERLFVLPAGPVPFNPSELFENSQFNLLVERLKTKFDVIFFDAPPINIVTDSMILCNKADGTVLVCSIGKTKSEALVETKKKIENLGGNIIGVVVNKMPMAKMKYYAKDYSKYSNQIIKIKDSKYRYGVYERKVEGK